MRFRFCGDLDCPEWVLAQIQNLSKLTSVKLKLMVTEVSRSFDSSELKFEKLSSLTSAVKFDESDVRASTAALEFILTTSAKNNTPPDVISDELQQLGLPKEHASAVSKVYSDSLEEIRKKLAAKSLRLNRLEDITWSQKKGISTPEGLVSDMTFASFQMNVSSGSQQVKHHRICMTQETMDSLISELESVKETMHRCNQKN